MTTETKEQEIGDALPFPDGFPVPPTEDLLSAIEQVLIYRASERGIRNIGLQDASMPLAAGLKRDALLPVMVDYLTNTIYQQSELRFDSDLMDTLSVDALEHGPDADPESEDSANGNTVESVQKEIARQVQRPLLYNRDDDDGLLFAQTDISAVATIPASVTFLMLDTALESAHNLSMTHQQDLAGEADQSELDLTPVMHLIERLEIEDRIIAPAALHARLTELREKAVNRQSTFGYSEAPAESPADTDQQEPKS